MDGISREAVSIWSGAVRRSHRQDVATAAAPDLGLRRTRMIPNPQCGKLEVVFNVVIRINVGRVICIYWQQLAGVNLTGATALAAATGPPLSDFNNG